MTSKPVLNQMDLSARHTLARNAEELATKKIWLPRLIYDGLPWFYLAAGLTAFLTTLYISEWFWVLPHYVLFSAACFHLAFTIYRRRRKARRESQEG